MRGRFVIAATLVQVPSLKVVFSGGAAIDQCLRDDFAASGAEFDEARVQFGIQSLPRQLIERGPGVLPLAGQPGVEDQIRKAQAFPVRGRGLGRVSLVHGHDDVTDPRRLINLASRREFLSDLSEHPEQMMRRLGIVAPGGGARAAKGQHLFMAAAPERANAPGIMAVSGPKVEARRHRAIKPQAQSLARRGLVAHGHGDHLARGVGLIGPELPRGFQMRPRFVRTLAKSPPLFLRQGRGQPGAEELPAAVDLDPPEDGLTRPLRKLRQSIQ